MAPSITAADCSTDRSDLVLKLTNAVFKTGDPKLLKDIPEDCKVLIKVLIKVLKKVQAASLPSPQLAAAEEAADLTLVRLLPPLQCDSRPGPCAYRRSPSDSPRSQSFSEPPVHF